MSQPSDEDIRVRAHQLWQQAGSPEDREVEFWYQAEHELKHPHAKTGDATTNPDEQSLTFTE